MIDTTRHPAPDERAPNMSTTQLTNTLTIASIDDTSPTSGVAHVTMPHGSKLSPYPAPTQPPSQNSPNTLLIPKLIEALDLGHATINQMVTTLPEN